MEKLFCLANSNLKMYFSFIVQLPSGRVTNDNQVFGSFNLLWFGKYIKQSFIFSVISWKIAKTFPETDTRKWISKLFVIGSSLILELHSQVRRYLPL